MNDNDAITKALQQRVLEKKGKLNFEVADRVREEVDIEFLKGHKKTITCLDITQSSKMVVTGGKDCCLIKWDLGTGKKEIIAGEKYGSGKKGPRDEILAVAINQDDRVMISSGKD